MNKDKKLQTKLDNKEGDIVTSFATYLMQKQQDEIDELKAKIKRLEKENEQLRAKLVTMNFWRSMRNE